MIRQRLHAVGGKFGRHAVRRFARLDVNDAAFVRPRAHEGKDLLVSAGLRRDAVSQVRAVETGDVARGILQVQLPDDVAAHALGGRGGERHHRHVGENFAQRRKLPVFRAEIVSPFADAMRLVNGEEVDVPFLQIFEKAGQHQPLRRDVEQPEFAVVQSAQARTRFAGGERRIQKGRRHARRLQRVHLVLHQRDERRDDHREPGPHERGELEAERFAAAGRQHGENVPARQRVADDFLLQRAKGTEAEELFQQREELVAAKTSPGENKTPVRRDWKA